MKVTGAWYLDVLPMHIVLELENGELKMAPITPLEPIKPERMTAYKGYHPRKCSGHPLPEYLYKFYGLEKDTESLTEVIRVRVSPSQVAKIEAYAKNNNMNVSEVLRKYIDSLY